MDPLLTPACRWIKTRKTWQTRGRLQYWHAPNNVRGPEGQIYTDSIGQYGQNMGWADDLRRGIDHQGWYTNEFGDEVIRGSVCRIRGAKGTLYVPVTSCTGWDGTVHYMRDAVEVPRGSPEEEHEEAMREAAGYADHHAEKEAERAREDYEADQRAQAVEDARERIKEAREAVHALLAGIRQAGTLPGVICETLRAEIQRNRRAVHRAVETIRENSAV